MADVELPDLPAAVVVNDSDLLHVRQGAEDKKATIQVLQGNLDIKYLRQDDNLASLANVATARANLDVLSISESGDTFLEETNNLSDLTNVSVARSNLGLGTMAVLDSGTGGTQFQTNTQNIASYVNGQEGTTGTDFRNNTDSDARYCLESNNLSDVTSPSTSFNNIKQNATTTSTGVVEEATSAEMSAGTNGKFPDAATIRAILPTASLGSTSGSWTDRATGFTVKWGNATANLGVTTFPVAFPSQCVYVGVTTKANSSTDNPFIADANRSRTGFTVQQVGSNSPVRYIAIGY